MIGSAEKGIVGSPWFGLGLGDWVRPWYMYSGSMDNFWLVMAVRYGVPGFLTVAAGYAIGLMRIMCRDFTGDRVLSQFRLAWVFTFMGLTFTLCTVHIWTNIYSFAFFFFGAGMWLITAQPKTMADALPVESNRQNDRAAPIPYRRFPQQTSAESTKANRTSSSGLARGRSSPSHPRKINTE